VVRGFSLLPEQASSFAQQVDRLFLFLTVVTVFFTLLVTGLVLFFAFRYRHGSRVRREGAKDTDLRLEIGWSLVPLIVGLTAFVWSAKLYAGIYGPPPADALEIFGVGKQWMWYFQHPNGVRENNELHVPLGRPVKMTLISQDVIHSFFVPAFRVKRDVLPGSYNMVWFVPTKPGKYHLFCAEYCGTQHSRMTGWVTVMKPEEYETWLTGGGSTSGVSGQGVMSNLSPEQMVAEGEKLYRQLRCNACHSASDTTRAPGHKGLYGKKVKLRDGSEIIADENYLRESILNPSAKVVAGYQPTMPSYGGLLNEERVHLLIAYLKSLSKSEERKKP